MFSYFVRVVLCVPSWPEAPSIDQVDLYVLRFQMTALYGLSLFSKLLSLAALEPSL